MNRSFVLLFFSFAFCEDSLPSLENPYMALLKGKIEAMDSQLALIKACVKKTLQQLPMSPGSEIREHCFGSEDQAIEHIYERQYRSAKQVMVAFMTDQFKDVKEQFPNELAFYHSNFVMFFEKKLGIQDALIETGEQAKYFVDPEAYKGIIEMGDTTAKLADWFGNQMADKKEKAYAYLNGLLEKRDLDLKLLEQIQNGLKEEEETE